MGAWEHFPYTNFHELNLDWILSKVKEFINKTDDISEQLNILDKDFLALKKYVTDYFDNLDLKQAVSDKLDEMLEDGELEAIINENILNYAPLSQDFSGTAVFRTREDYYKDPTDVYNSSHCGFQNGTMYSPLGNYSEDGQRYFYTWKTWSDNSIPELITIDVNTNSVISRLDVANGEHGGPLFVYNNNLYSINNNYTLFIFDISNPGAPALAEQRTLSNQYYIIGHDDNGFILIDNDKKVYSSTDFDNVLYKFTLEERNIDITQDYSFDPVKYLIYRISFRPNIIHVYSAQTGEKLSTIRIPSVINYIGMGETESVFVHGNNIYFSGQVTTGLPPTTQMDFALFYENINNRAVGRELERAEAALKIVKVDYLNGDPLNGGIGNSADYVFKYIEDAQNAVQSVNSGQITFLGDYPESFHIYENCIINFDNYKTGAIKVDENVNTILYAINSQFLGESIQFQGRTLRPWIYAGINSNLTIRSVPNIEVDTDEIGIWIYRAQLKTLTKAYINNVFLEESRLFTPGILNQNIYAKQSLIVAFGFNLQNGDSQFIDLNTTIKARAIVGTADRFYMDDIDNYQFCSQGNFYPLTGNIAQNRPLPAVSLFIASAGPATINIGYWSAADTYTLLPYSLSRSEIQLSDETFGFNAYRYSITEGSTPFPHLIGIFNYQA